MLLSRIKVAVVERAKHVQTFKQFKASLPQASVEQWTDMVTAWEDAPLTARNPFEYKRSREFCSLQDVLAHADTLEDVTQAALRVILAEEDAEDIRQGRASALHQYYSSSTLVVVGMEIEDVQYVPSAHVMAALPDTLCTG